MSKICWYLITFQVLGITPAVSSYLHWMQNFRLFRWLDSTSYLRMQARNLKR
jgi:hypothetical protein